MKTAIIFADWVFFAMMPAGLPLLYALRTGSFGRTLQLGWLMLVVWMMAEALLVPTVVEQFEPSLVDYFPDGPAVVPAVFCGWMWGFLIAAIGMAIRSLMEHLWPEALRRLCNPL